MLNFRQFTWDDKDRYTKIYQQTPVHYAEYSFFGLWAWLHAYPLEIAYTENLCWMKSSGKFPGIFGPSGNWDAVTDWEKELSHFNSGDVIYEVPAGIIEKLKGDSRFRFTPELDRDKKAAISEAYSGIIEELSGSSRFRFTLESDQSEYVYAVKDLISLKGKAYAHKRNRVRAFLDGYEWDYYELTPDFFDEVLEFQERWRVHRNETMNDEEAASLYDEDIAIRNAFEKWNEFRFSGGIIKVDEKIIAYTITEELDEKNLDVRFEKAFSEYAGSYQAINYMFMKNHGYKYEWANREEDMGEPGLREAKMSYNPAMMLEKYELEIL